MISDERGKKVKFWIKNMDADMFLIHFWVVAPCEFSGNFTSYTIYISAKNHCGAAFKTCPDFFLVPFEVVEKLSKWSHALSKTSPKQFGRRPEWKIQFQSCRICRHFEELAKLSASRKTFIQAKKKKVLLRSFCDFNNLTGQNNLSIDYFIFSKWFVFHELLIS